MSTVHGVWKKTLAGKAGFPDRQQAAVSRQWARQTCGMYFYRQEYSHHRDTKELGLSAMNLKAATTSSAKERLLLFTGFAVSSCW